MVKKLLLGILLTTVPMLGGASEIIRGIVFDPINEIPVDFASVSLLSTADSSLIRGTTTGSNGEFELPAEPGNYLIQVTFLGYKTHTQSIEVEQDGLNLGTINFTESAETLQEVSVEAAALMFRSEIDKRVYDVENHIASEGGTAIQLLENLPSVQVDDEGQINLRGSSNILIYINGRPTNLSADDTESILEQYPANAIKSVEIITNPSARFDAEGVGGIINLILNETELRGFNGQVNVGIGSGHKYAAGANLHYRTNDFNFSLAYNYQYRERWGFSETIRESFRGQISPVLDQEYNTERNSTSHLIRPGIEYQINDYSSLNLFSTINVRSRDRERLYEIRSKDLQNNQDSAYLRLLEEDQSRTNTEVGLNYQTNFGLEGDQLNLTATFAQEDQERIEYFDQDFLNSMDEVVPEKRALQTYERPMDKRLWVFQADYSRPLGVFEFETGLKATITNEFLEQIFNEFNFSENQWETNDLISNQFDFDEQVYAAYSIFSGKKGKWGYQAGLRVEYTHTESYQPQIDSVHSNNYFDLFPSAFLTYEVGDKAILQASYSRRISRPNSRRLMPFINAQDLLNLRIGNPYLQPEYTDNYEVSFDKMWENFFFTTSLFHRNATNTFTRVYLLFGDRSSIVTWQNADQRKNTGLEMVKQLFLGRSTDISLTSSVFYSHIIGEDDEGAYHNSRYSWTLNLMSNMRVYDWFNFQLTANYRGPIVIPQGTIDPRFTMNIGLRREILNRKATISLSLTDVFNTRNFTLNTESANFKQRRFFERESQVLNLSFTYRFKGYQDRSERRGSNQGDDIDDAVF